MEPKTPSVEPVTPPAPVPEGKAATIKAVVNENKPKPKAEEIDPIDALKKSGFATKEEVLSFLKAIDREKTMTAVRTKELQEEEAKIAKQHVMLDQRERDMEAKGAELQEKLKENKILVARNQEYVAKLSSLNLK